MTFRPDSRDSIEETLFIDNGQSSSSATVVLSPQVVEQLIHAIQRGSINDLQALKEMHPEVSYSSVIINEEHKQNLMFSVLKSPPGKRVEVARYLQTTMGVDPNLADVYQQTCLFYAARDGMTEFARYLLQEGKCDPNHVDSVQAQTALFYAAA